MAPIRNNRRDKGKEVMTTVIVGEDMELNQVLPNNEVIAPDPPQESDDSDDLYPLTAEQFYDWQTTRNIELETIKDVEKVLKYYKRKCEYYAEMTSRSEDLEWRMKAIERERKKRDAAQATRVEEVQSNFNHSRGLEFDGMCILCKNRMANIVYLPCRHLCYCSDCNNRSGVCLICDTPKVDSIKVNKI